MPRWSILIEMKLAGTNIQPLSMPIESIFHDVIGIDRELIFKKNFNNQHEIKGFDIYL